MTNNWKRLIAMILAGLMLLSGICVSETDGAADAPVETVEPAADAPAETVEPTEAVDTVYCTFGDITVMTSEIQAYATTLNSNGYLDSAEDLDTAMSYYAPYVLIPQMMIEEYGCDVMTEEDEAAMKAEAQAEWDLYGEMYTANYGFADFDAFYAYCYESIKQNTAYKKLYDRLGVEVTDAEVIDYYNAEIENEKAYLAQYASYFGSEAAAYEYMVNYYKYEMYYIPEGYRGVTHILLEADEELLAKYNELTEAGEDAEAIEQARQAVLAFNQVAIDDIMARLDAGETFESLIAEYGTDPGMQDAATLADGYMVNKDSIAWMQAFTDGAFQEGMTAPGSVSEPVVSSYGVHILYYLRDIPSGGVELTDEIFQTFEDALYNSKISQIFSDKAAEYEIVKPE